MNYETLWGQTIGDTCPQTCSLYKPDMFQVCLGGQQPLKKFKLSFVPYYGNDGYSLLNF